MTIQQKFMPQFKKKFPEEFAAQRECEKSINDWAEVCSIAVKKVIEQNITKSLQGPCKREHYFKDGKFGTFFSAQTSTRCSINGYVEFCIKDGDILIETTLAGNALNQSSLTKKVESILKEYGITTDDDKDIRDIIWVAKF